MYVCLCLTVLFSSCICSYLFRFFLQFIVDKLFWPETALLEAVGLHEPQVDTLRDKISSTISAAIIPMKAYAQQYMPYLDLMNLDIDAYIK